MPKLSVIMSAYNEEKNIARAIESVLEQTFEDFEFIVVNDGSTDNTLEVISRYQDERIRVLDKGYNVGLVESLNIGIRYSTGELIARMDADDYSHRERFRVQVEFLEDNPDVTLVGSWAYLVDKITGARVECTPPTAHKYIVKYMQKDNPFIHSSVVLRKNALEGVGFYNDIRAMEDYDLWIRLAKRHRVANVPEFLITRYEDDNLRTRFTYRGLKRGDMYRLRLRHQMMAVKNFGFFPETVWYVTRTLVSMMLFRLNLRS